MKISLTFIALLAISAPLDLLAQSNQEISLAKQVLANAQAKSISQNREYCGYLGYTAGRKLASTKPTRGKRDECQPRWPRGLNVVASWHTHAGADAGAWSEVPTVVDIEADEAEGVDGYVGTPGGRVWFVDTTDMMVSQICGLRCLPSDAGFVRGSEGTILQSYTYRQLLMREAE